MSTRELTKSALLLAVMCVASQLSITIPVSPVPMTMGTAGLYLAATLQKPRGCVLTLACYLLMGAIGLPVFAGFMGGISRLAGPTGGYLVSYIPSGYLASCGHQYAIGKKNPASYIFTAVSLLAAMLVCHAMGSAWLSISNHISFVAALGIGSLPYVPLELVKIAVCMAVMKLTERLSYSA